MQAEGFEGASRVVAGMVVGAKFTNELSHSLFVRHLTVRKCGMARMVLVGWEA